MKLVSSNEPSFAQETVEKAKIGYQKDQNVTTALDVLTKLKGIGPATASLLLAVLDPEHVTFFADEVFYWLCCDGKQLPIKYNAKEYKDLNERSQKLAKRLNVKAVDIERVAYVLLKQQDVTPVKSEMPKDKDTKTIHTAKAETTRKSRTDAPGKASAKRKQRSDDVADEVTPVRRSKRGQRV